MSYSEVNCSSCGKTNLSTWWRLRGCYQHARKREPEFPSFFVLSTFLLLRLVRRALRACPRFPEIHGKAVPLHHCLFSSCSLLPCYIPFHGNSAYQWQLKTVKFFHPPFQNKFPSDTLFETPCSRLSLFLHSAGISQFPGSNSGCRDLSSLLSDSQMP